MKETIVYVVVRETEDSEFNSIDVFQNVFFNLKDAKKNLKELREDFGPTFKILKREVI